MDAVPLKYSYKMQNDYDNYAFIFYERPYNAIILNLLPGLTHILLYRNTIFE